ncbi:uncharacterized protein si:ch211-102c2.4 isoform X1 [Megalops cyprinoides]|uniref:uncharacterized protein si:ch211-102c2.4 isoform X1 n=1 Tax=Megalops cyprinoides TaxID=118141 RepID=UPI001864FCB9|nr:uncharacterized protein si:ch211-102c2.4 isoform X1 [Megalops cyprinoides]
MLLFHITLMLGLVGVCQCYYAQTLTCPHEDQQRGLHRIWCKQNSTLCCHGFAFSNGTRWLESEGVRVHYDSSSFTITVLQLSQGPGVYWCGLLDHDQTIIKLAEAYFHDPTPAYIWSIFRWILMPLLPLSVISMHFYTKRKVHKDKVGEDLYEDIHMQSLAHREGDVQHHDNAMDRQ